jgi:CRISPR type IV-associated protein Csf2
MDIRLEGTITARTPISVSRADVHDRDKGVVLQRVMEAGSATKRPVIAGETIKGALRAASNRALLGRLGTRYERIQPMYRNMIGGVKGRAKQDPVDILKVRSLRKANPIVSLFGLAEPMWLSAHLQVQWAIPRVDDCIAEIGAAARRDPTTVDPALFEALAPAEQAKYFAYQGTTKEVSEIRGRRTAIKRQIAKIRSKDVAEPGDAQQIEELAREDAGLDAQIAALRNGQDVGETVGRPLSTRKAIAAGTVMDHALVLCGNEVSDIEVGLLLATLEEMSEDCRLGGGRSAGHGAFEASYDIRVREAKGQPWSAPGRLTLGAFKFDLPADPLLDRARAAFDAAMADPQAHGIDIMFDAFAPAVADEAAGADQTIDEAA